MRLSVLDLSPIPSGSSATQALRNTIDLARHAEAIGLHRYWLAEHHNAGALASSSPEIVMAAVGAATSTIRIGSGGIMLPNHAPLKIAEAFRVLSALYPDRVDLGVGRAAGTDPKTALLLRQSPALANADQFPEQLDELLTFLHRETDPASRFGPIKAIPTNVAAPPVFLLGSGLDSAIRAARLGLGYAFAHHISMEPGMHVRAMRAYRESFRANANANANATATAEGAQPYAILTVAVLCAADDQSAEDMRRCADLAYLRFGQGIRDLPMPSIEEARAYTFDGEEEVFRTAARSRYITGDPSRVRDILTPMIEETGADELMVMTGIHDHDERKRSYDRVRAMLAS